MTGRVTGQERVLMAQNARQQLGQIISNVRIAYVFLYLVAIVAANLLTVWLGPWVTPINGFVFIGMDITTRDQLHDAWKHKGLWWKMALLIGGGSLLSWVLNRNAGRVALASFVAFGASGVTDALVYHALRKWSKFERVNWSNLASAAVDSVLFPALAFGWPPDMAIVYGQATAKVGGGLFWSLVMLRTLSAERPALEGGK